MITFHWLAKIKLRASSCLVSPSLCRVQVFTVGGTVAAVAHNYIFHNCALTTLWKQFGEGLFLLQNDCACFCCRMIVPLCTNLAPRRYGLMCGGTWVTFTDAWPWPYWIPLEWIGTPNANPVFVSQRQYLTSQIIFLAERPRIFIKTLQNPLKSLPRRLAKSDGRSGG